jgi:hypothetical protein
VRRRVRALALLAAAALAGGCLDDFEPEVGEPLRPLCTDEDSDEDVDVSFAADIFEGLFDSAELACTDCHSPRGANPIGLRASGLNLSSFAALMRGGDRSADTIVVPGRPCESVLVQKVGQAPPFGARMPLDGPPFLSDGERQLLSDWIAEGADDD